MTAKAASALLVVISAGLAQEPPIHSLTALIKGNDFVRVAPGEFTMGSDNDGEDERPIHSVRITSEFEIGKYEVTQAQWVAIMDKPHARPKPGEKPADVNPSRFRGPSLPVESVSWDAVQQFIGILNSRDPAHTYRLPTEAEWEYAARAGAPSTNTSQAGWCESDAAGETHPVGEKPANAWGLHDMIGNVFEWVSDWYGSYPPDPVSDPQGASSKSYKVYRGGAWLSAAKQCRPGYRGFDLPISGYYSVGFRLVRTPKV
jgi:formylglycine-generating enzyme required for sulfatase activity